MAYVAPFATYAFFLGLRRYLPIGPETEYALRILTVAAVALIFSRNILRGRPARKAASTAVGAAAFVIWIAPDLLFPGMRAHWLFENALTGSAHSSLPESLRGSTAFLALRIAGSAAIVPVAEELFWRGWLMRWLVSRDFHHLPLGACSAFSFWATAVLFASEHGPYWDVGLAAGIVYNWWMIRTSSIPDCVLAHGVTNLLLGVWVVGAGQYQYWL